MLDKASKTHVCDLGNPASLNSRFICCMRAELSVGTPYHRQYHSPVSTATEFLSSCQDELNVSLCWGVVLIRHNVAVHCVSNFI
jgi:hypothetical protein